MLNWLKKGNCASEDAPRNDDAKRKLESCTIHCTVQIVEKKSEFELKRSIWLVLTICVLLDSATNWIRKCCCFVASTTLIEFSEMSCIDLWLYYWRLICGIAPAERKYWEFLLTNDNLVIARLRISRVNESFSLCINRCECLSSHYRRFDDISGDDIFDR